MAAGGFAQSGEITVTSVQQRTDGSGLVDWCFNLFEQYTIEKATLQIGSDESYVHFTNVIDQITCCNGYDISKTILRSTTTQIQYLIINCQIINELLKT